MVNKKEKGLFKVNKAIKYTIALGVGVYIGVGGIPDNPIGILYMIFGVVCAYLAVKGDKESLFTLLPYFVYSELYVRSNSHIIPYIFSQYTLLAIFLFLIARQGGRVKLYSRSFILILLYALIELVDSYRTYEPDFARVAVVNSLLLLVVSFWASTTILPLPLLNKLINNFKTASVYLTGTILAAHIYGHIDYGGASNFASSNGLPPVQISGFLGVGTILFFLSIVNELERKDIFLNIVFFSIILVIMLLTFSRGGLYFLAVIMMLYFIFNRKKLGNYLIFLLLMPVGMLIYYYVTSTTGGLILDRYEQSGSSGRDELVEAGFEILQQDPIAGVGTGNFSKEIIKRHLYEVESGAHNEFVRAAAEHGVLGIFTYWGFYIFLFFEIIGRQGVFRQYSLYFFVLFCLILVHNGLKTSVQPMLLIFAIATPSFVIAKKKNNVPAIKKQPGRLA